MFSFRPKDMSLNICQFCYVIQQQNWAETPMPHRDSLPSSVLFRKILVTSHNPKHPEVQLHWLPTLKRKFFNSINRRRIKGLLGFHRGRYQAIFLHIIIILHSRLLYCFTYRIPINSNYPVCIKHLGNLLSLIGKRYRAMALLSNPNPTR